MNERNRRVALRRTVARRLSGFFTDWLAQLAAGSATLWERVERQLTEPHPDDETSATRVPMQQQPMQQQPAQQQQQRKQDE
jgi:hypothetical protein